MPPTSNTSFSNYYKFINDFIFLPIFNERKKKKNIIVDENLPH